MTSAESGLDGRRARGIRTRDAIVSALLDLIGGGEVAPTAQQLANRAGVSIRSVYQHFTDVETLYTDAAARTFAWVVSLSEEIDPTEELDVRVERFVVSRAEVLEHLVPFNRAARLLEPTTPLIREKRREFISWAEMRITRTFGPELDTLEPARAKSVAGAVEVLTGVGGWEQLREGGHSERSATDVLRVGVTALLRS